MSYLVYNNIPLGIVRTRTYEKTAEFEGPNYVRTKVLLSVEAVYNPSTVQKLWASASLAQTTETIQQVGFGQPIGPQNLAQTSPDIPPVLISLGGLLPASMAPTTDEALRHRLMFPRQSLTYVVGSKVVIQSPQQNVTTYDATGINVGNQVGVNLITDANNGPFPQAIEIQWQGQKTANVTFTIITYLNESYLWLEAGTTPPIITSHLWTEEIRLDQDFYETRTRRGRAVFNQAMMSRFNLQPDQFRDALGPPVLAGFKRDKVHVSLADDGTHLDYYAEDRQLPISISTTMRNYGITRIEGFFEDGFTSQSFEDVVFEIQVAAIGASLNSIGSAATAGSPTFSGIPGFAGGQIQTIGNLVNQEKIIRRRGLPRRQRTMHLTFWGDTNSYRSQMASQAVNAIIQVLGNLGTLTTISATNMKVRHYIHEKRVEAVVTFDTSPLDGQIPQTFVSLLEGPTSIAAKGFDRDAISGYTVDPGSGPFLAISPSTAPTIGRMTGTNYLAMMIAAITSDPDDGPIVPELPPVRSPVGVQ